MQYTAVTIKLPEADPEKIDILIALMDSLSFEGITELKDHVIGYIETDIYDRKELLSTLDEMRDGIQAEITKEEKVKNVNWNEEWEKNFDPVIVDNRCVIRAPFHKKFPSMEYVIDIEPKMSFGTGHHETTSLMISSMLGMDFSNKTVLDMGCGTGVLGIFAAIKGAKEVVAIDNDKWAYENTIDNIKLNKVEMTVLHGGADKIPNIEFDVILANINRNILIEQASEYNQALSFCGKLLVSGFLADDIVLLEETFKDLGLTPVNHTSMGNWQLVEFVK
jgi:ribosomal protein L11 methyltransferase